MTKPRITLTLLSFPSCIHKRKMYFLTSHSPMGYINHQFQLDSESPYIITIKLFQCPIAAQIAAIEHGFAVKKGHGC